MQKNIIGVDLGATSGRVILARAGDDRLRMEELHRFPNRMREIDGRFYWDIHALYEEILRGLSVAGGRGERIDSIGIDTWGVDFACVDPDGDLLGLPRAYRDPYTNSTHSTASTAPRWRPPSMCSSCPMRCRTCLRANRCANIRSSPPRS